MMFLCRLAVSLALFAWAIAPLDAAPAPEIEDQTRAIATELRCVVCQNLSVADSPSEMAQQMRAVVREQLEAGKTPEQVKEFFVSKYGEWVLLKPRTTGVSALLWILPYAVLLLGVAAALWLVRRWAAVKKPGPAAVPIAATEINDDALIGDFERPDPEDSSARASLLRQRAKLQDELAELDFDFQSGKLSESDHTALKQEIDRRVAVVSQQLRALPAEPPSKRTPRETMAHKKGTTVGAERSRFRRWQLVSGAVFLVVFGLTLGVVLTQSLRPRLSENDTVTGDFLTGTRSSNSAVRTALAEGKTAFAHREFPKAIEAFKKALAADPDNPEAHAYMGYILLQAGHGDGALMAFDKALSGAPNFPMALWGKGMVLYRDKQDVAAAREIFEKLLSLVPPGEERNEITKVLAEMPAAGTPTGPSKAPATKSATSSTTQISGRITVAPELKAKVNPAAVLFVIARPAGAASGPPLAVKRITQPRFPLDYVLSQDNVMMQGTPFTGSIAIAVRLDNDGDPVSRGAGDLTGDYKKNPVNVGTKDVDVVLDQLTR
jgi:cytochrome c-type biogenesis protein CcmH